MNAVFLRRNFDVAVSKFKSLNRAIRRGHVNNIDFSLTKRNKNNRKRTKYRAKYNSNNNNFTKR